MAKAKYYMHFIYVYTKETTGRGNETKKKRTWPEQIGCQPLMCARKFKELPLWADT